MSLKNNHETYGLVARLFHWVMAALIIGLLTVGLWMGELEGPFRGQVYGVHKALGIIVLLLVVGRISWRLMNPPPPMLPMPAVQRLAAHSLHIFLYIAMIVMPLSGWAMSSAAGYPVSMFGLFELPALLEKNKEIGHVFHEIHEILGTVLIAALLVHIGAALLHHFVLKDATLMRMLKGAVRHD